MTKVWQMNLGNNESLSCQGLAFVLIAWTKTNCELELLNYLWFFMNDMRTNKPLTSRWKRNWFWTWFKDDAIMASLLRQYCKCQIYEHVFIALYRYSEMAISLFSVCICSVGGPQVQSVLGLELLECLYWRRGALLYMYCHTLHQRKQWIKKNKDTFLKVHHPIWPDVDAF